MRKLSCDPGIEVIGHGVLAFTDNIAASQIGDILVRHKLTSIEPEGWYNMNDLLDVLNEIVERHMNITMNYVAMGMKRAESAKMPPNADKMTLPEFLNNWNNVYQMQHRGGDVGQLKVKAITDTHYEVTYDIIYPDDFIYGVAWGFTKRFLPKGTSFVVKYDENVIHKDKGGQSTVIHISWEQPPSPG